MNACSRHVCHALPAGTALWGRPRHWWPPRWPPGLLLQAGIRRSLPQTWRVETLATIRSTSHSPLPHLPGSQRLPRKRRRRLLRCVRSGNQNMWMHMSKQFTKVTLKLASCQKLLWSRRVLVTCIPGLNLPCLCCILEWHELLFCIASHAYVPLQLHETSQICLSKLNGTILIMHLAASPQLSFLLQSLSESLTAVTWNSPWPTMLTMFMWE